jgi:hypothetical protein
MHKTLYIDVDEEITSIIDRVRRAEAGEVIIIAPKNALILQGIVNLKLLKKEADRQKKQLLIVTQDKFGKKMIEKAGILAQTKAENDIFLEEETDEGEYEPIHPGDALAIKEELQREEKVGSSNFFDEKEAPIPEVFAEDFSSSSLKIAEQQNAPGKKATKKAGGNLKTKINMSDIVINQAPPKRKKAKIKPAEKQPEREIIISEAETFSEAYVESNAAPPKISQVSMKKAEKFFRQNKKMKKNLEVARVGGGAKKFFIFFSLIVALLILSAVIFFLLPKATLAPRIKSSHQTVSLDLIASSQVGKTNADEKSLPAGFEQIEKDFSEDFEATGTAKGGSKAGGKVLIYNEYSSEDQPLVTMTRLTTSDGKIFRITKNIVIPGTSKVGGETKPGAIEAEVVADQPGEDYNISPSDFKIVGFKNNADKYEKFYAKSSDPMSGGLSGEGKIVTAQDIATAKEKVSADAKKHAADYAKEALPAGQKIFDNSIQTEIMNVSVSDNAGSAKEKFSAVAKMRLSILSLQEADVKDLMRDSLVRSGAKSSEILFNQSIDYILSSVDFQQKSIDFQAKTGANITSKLDVENFRKGILGKTAEDAQSYAKNFDAIEKIDITFWPFFVKRMPMIERKIDIQENTAD